MRYHWVIPLIGAIFDLLACIFVFFSNKKSVLNKSFAWFAFTVFLWNLDIFVLYFLQDKGQAFFWSKIFRFGLFFTPAALFHFISIFTGLRCKSVFWRALPIGGYSLALVLGIADLFDLVVRDLRRYSWGFYTEATPLYNFFTFSILFFVSLSIFALAREYRLTPSSRKRLQVKFLFLGLLISLSLVFTNLPALYGFQMYPFGNLGSISSVGFMAYLVVERRPVGLNVVIEKTFVYPLSMALVVVPVWILATSVQEKLLGLTNVDFTFFLLLCLLITGVTSSLSKNLVERGFASVFKRRYDYREALRDFSRAMTRMLDPQKLVNELTQTLVNAISLESSVIYLVSKKGDAYDSQSPASGEQYLQGFKSDEPLVLWLAHQDDAVVKEELELFETSEEASEVIRVLKETKTEVSLPLKIKDQLIGFINLGGKRNRDAFTREDLQLLSTVANEAAVALENARLYEELKRSQELLARSDRLAAVGTLAAGIAHEIRNPLVSIHTFTQLLPERLDDPEFRTSFLHIASTEVARASDLIDNLMTFARPSPSVIREVDLNAVLEQIVLLLGGQAKKAGIVLTLSSSPLLPPVRADEGQVKQIFMNLLLNALQATAAGGEVSLTTQTLQGQGRKEYCRVEVRDTGQGIPAAHKERIFDPFFTTKDSGTGLGLFIAHQIVAEHEGYMDVESEVGAGTSFYVHLPCAQAQEGETARVALDGGQMAQACLLKAGTGKR